MKTVFISYAREDRDAAFAIYDLMNKHGIDCWIDEKNLIAGENWELQIAKAVRNSAVFVACLSTRSVSKVGYVQSELKKALKVLETMPEGRSFVIPVLLDQCEVPSSLSHLHWVAYYSDVGPTALLNAVIHHLSLDSSEKLVIRSSKLRFAALALDKRTRYWKEVPGGDRDRRRYFYLYGSVKDESIAFDITVLNSTSVPTVINAVGVEIIKVFSVSWLGAAIPRAVKIKQRGFYKIDMPDFFKRFRKQLIDDREEVDVNEVVSMSLRDPVYIQPQAPFRYGLLLNRFGNQMPNHVILRFWLGTDSGVERSEEIHVTTQFLYIEGHFKG